MFEKLVETENNTQQTGRQAGYLGITTVIYGGIFLALFVWSLYSINLNASAEELTMSALVAPVEVPETVPPIDEPARQTKSTEKAQVSQDVRTAIVQNLNETQNLNVAKTATGVKARRAGVETIIGTKNIDGNVPGSDSPIKTDNEIGLPTNTTKQIEREVEELPELVKVKPSPQPTPKAKSVTLTKGVVTGLAKSLPKPAYPFAAKSARVSGAVKVQVLIDESGNVISASALEGHGLLRAAAVSAARGAKFSPTLLSNQPVKVSGVIIYNFQP